MHVCVTSLCVLRVSVCSLSGRLILRFASFKFGVVHLLWCAQVVWNDAECFSMTRERNG